MTDFPPSPFWDFSLRVYGREGVAPACLALQERHRVDVNVLLFCAWIGVTGRGRLATAEIEEIRVLVTDWHERVVRLLRKIRVDLREGMAPMPEDLARAVRRRIQKVELDAEHAEQVLLTDWAGARAEATAEPELALADAAANMTSYLDTLDARLDRKDRADLTAILIGCGAEAGPVSDLAVEKMLSRFKF